MALGTFPGADVPELDEHPTHRSLYQATQNALFRAGNIAADFKVDKDSFSIDDYVKWALAIRTRVEPHLESQWIDKLASDSAYGFRVRALNRVGVSAASDETKLRLVTRKSDLRPDLRIHEDKDGAIRNPAVLDLATRAESPVRSLQYLRPVRPFSLEVGDGPVRIPSARLVSIAQNLFRAIGVQNDGEACGASLRPPPLTPKATPGYFDDAWRQATGFGLLFEMLTGRVRLGLREALNEALAREIDDDDDDDDGATDQCHRHYGASRTSPPKFAAGDEVEATENIFLKAESPDETNKGDRVVVMPRSLAEAKFTSNHNMREETRWSDTHSAACDAIGNVLSSSPEMVLLQFDHIIRPLWFPKKAVTFDLSAGTFRRAVVDAVHGDGTYRLLVDGTPIDLVPERSIRPHERADDDNDATKTDRQTPLVCSQRVRVLRPKVTAPPTSTTFAPSGGAVAADVDTVEIVPALAIVMEVKLQLP